MIDHLNPDSKLKAVNAFIFAGSFSIGVMKAGFHLDRVLEISDQQPEQNAYYFMQNSTVPVILPSEWENDKYLASIKNVDLMCANCPCSSLSQINRNASVEGKNNVHFYRLFKMFNAIKPKVFVIENAPTLIKLGFPILKDLVNNLGDTYRFTILRDYAGNHNVPMRRMRTMVVGWRRDVFSKIPKISPDKHANVTVRDTLKDILDDTTEDYKSMAFDNIRDAYKYCPPGDSLMTGLAKQCIANNHKDEIVKIVKDSNHFNELNRIISKLEQKVNYWDKSPYKLQLDTFFPSFTSAMEYLHPTQDRMLNLKEMARIMNYPDDYSFKGKCSIPVIQAMAQGVPANFGYYISTQARLALEGKLSDLDDKDIAFQHQTTKGFYKTFTKDEFMALDGLEPDKTYNKLT